MAAGKRNTLVQFQRSQPELDEYGEEVDVWSDIGGGEWAAILWGAGAERRAAAQEEGSQAVTFQVPDNTLTRSLTVKDRIVWEGDWDITGIATPKPGEREFTAVRAT
jgi:head-tail adaptor